jgi:hypothetical protein
MGCGSGEVGRGEGGGGILVLRLAPEGTVDSTYWQPHWKQMGNLETPVIRGELTEIQKLVQRNKKY